MGQYYTGVIGDAAGPAIVPYEQFTSGCMKLTEHSWWENDYVNFFCREIYKKPKLIAWVGDYAMDADKRPSQELFDIAWGEDSVVTPERVDFTLDGKYLVNHVTKQYLDCSAYRDRNNGAHGLGNGWIIHPLPLLTAFGNGQGGGDYQGKDEKWVGAWAWDPISVEDSPPTVGFSEIKVDFFE